MSEGVVVVGASMGGLRLAESLRRFGYAGSIKVFGNEGYAPYNRPPLSKDLLSAAEIDFAEVAFPQRSATADVEWHLSAGAVSADLSNRQITISGGEQVSFEHLVIATGLRSKRLGFNTFPADRHALRSFDDAKAEVIAALRSAKLDERSRALRQAIRRTDNIGIHIYSDLIPTE